MIDIQKLKRARAALVEEMRKLLESVETRDEKSLTSDEGKKFDEMQREADSIAAQISRAEFLNGEEAVGSGEVTPEERDKKENFGEFLVNMRNGKVSDLETRDLTAGDGPSAGFLIPEQTDTTMREVRPDDAVMRPRCLVMPAGTPPDAALSLIALDQSGDKGVYGGVQTNWVDEVGTIQDAGDPKIRGIKIEPKQISGYIDVSDKLLRNAAAVGAMVERLLRGAIIGAEEDAFWNGKGVGKPLGLLNSPACINITRDTASSLKYLDLVAMYASTMGTNLMWVASRRILPDLMTMVAPNTNQLVWQPNAREGAPSPLLGLPLEFNEYSPVLGTRGDLALVDLDYYAIKDGSPTAMFMDPYTQKVNSITRIYAFWNVDGQGMLNSPIIKQDKKTKVSPFVVLK